GKRRRQEDQGENESHERSHDEHAPPLAEQNLAVQQALKRRVGLIRGAVHHDPSARLIRQAGLWSFTIATPAVSGWRPDASVPYWVSSNRAVTVTVSLSSPASMGVGAGALAA